MLDERIGRRKFSRRGAALGVSISALGGSLSWCADTWTAEKNGGSAITIPIAPSAWLPALETAAETCEQGTGNEVNLLVAPQNQLFPSQLLATDAGSYDRQTP